MNKIIIFPLLTLMMSLLSCGSNSKESMYANILAEQGEAGLVNKLVADNEFIDVDLYAVQSGIVSEDASRKSADEFRTDMAKAKAAIYRFYSHVSLVDGEYVLDNCTAKDLNISPELFETMSQDIEKSNGYTREARKNGEAVEMTPITQEYLESLLR